MRHFLFLLLLVSISCSNPKKGVELEASSKSKFEEYDKNIWKAMLFFKDKEFDQSLENFENAFNILQDENSTDYFFAAAAALKLDKNEKAKKLIIDAITKANASESYYDIFEDFNPFRERDLFTEIKSNYSNYRAEFFDKLPNPEIYHEIQSLIEKDQTVRKNGSPWEEIRRVDSLNIKRLIEINKEYGWQKNQWLLLWHQRGTYRDDHYVWNYFRPFINEQIEKGSIRKDFWALFDEEKLMIEGGVQKYGLYLNNFDQYPIERIEKVDSLRATIGKPPLWYMQKVYGHVLPEEYKGTAPNNAYNTSLP